MLQLSAAVAESLTQLDTLADLLAARFLVREQQTVGKVIEDSKMQSMMELFKYQADGRRLI